VSYEPQPPQAPQQYPPQQHPAQPNPLPPYPPAPQPPAPLPFPGGNSSPLPPDLRGLAPKPTYANEFINAEDDLDRAADEKVDDILHFLRYRSLKYVVRIGLLVLFIFAIINQKAWSAALTGFLSGNPLIQIISQLLFAIVFISVQFGAFFFLMGRPRVQWMMPGEGGVGFADYKGNPEVLEGARRVVTLLRGAKAFKQMGGEVIRGLLLEGPPGTGKSYLAQAISTEAKIPFCYCSAPSLIGVVMGMGALQTTMIYRKARKLSLEYGACIIFFDEIDAVAQARGGTQGGGMMGGGMMGGMMGGGGGGGVLNTLLTNMDPMPKDYTIWRSIARKLHILKGKAETPPVLTIGATNIATTLDPALLRPGRFDRNIHVDLPDADGRREIIEYYLAKVTHDPMPVERLVHETIGYTPVAIKYVINEAVVHAHFDDRTSINYWDFSRAREVHEMGLRQPIKSMSYRDKQLVAYHEAGHAYAQVKLLPRHRIGKVTIVRHGKFGGFSEARAAEEIHDYTREDLLAQIQVNLASGAAQEVLLGVRSLGMVSDLETATSIAGRMVMVEGMYDSLFSTGAMGAPDGDQRKQIERILQEQNKKVKFLITEHAEAVRAIAEELLVRDELIDMDVLHIISRYEALPQHYGAEGEVPMVYNERPGAFGNTAAFTPPTAADGD